MLLVSTYVYAFARRHGPRWLERVKEELRKGLASELAGIRTLSQAATLEPCVTHVSGPSRIAPARSQTAGAFLRSEADVWVTADDDVYASAEVLSQLVRACRVTRGIVSAPCLQRDDARDKNDPGVPNIRMRDAPTFSEGDGWTLASIHQTGMGLVALHREAIEAMALAHPELEVEEGGMVYPALFADVVQGRKWYGEDVSFSHRARAVGVRLDALCNAEVVHDDRPCKFEVHGGEVFFRVYDVAVLELGR